MVKVDNGGFKPIGCGEDVIGYNTWDKVRKEFPEESGIRPIYIDYPFQLLYFPHKANGKNIFHARNPKWADSMSSITSKSLNNLDDEKTIVPLLKEKMRSYRAHRKKLDQQKKDFKKHPDNCKDITGGNK